MARTTVADTVVIVDDEPHNMSWMVDYLEAKGLSAIIVSDVNSAIYQVDKEIYRAIIVDLNVPVLPPLDGITRDTGTAYARFPGLYVARHARNRGY